MGVTKNNAIVIIAAVLYMFWGTESPTPRKIFIACLILISPYVLYLWEMRKFRLYNELQRTMVYGDWKKARQIIHELRRSKSNPDVLTMDLDVREARVNIREGMPLEVALQGLRDRWQAVTEKIPGTFAGRAMSLYEEAEDFAGFLTCVHEYLDGQPNAQDRRLDCAMVEARFGDLAVARKLLDSVDASQLMPEASHFRNWAIGVVTLGEGKLDESIPALRNAVAGYEESSKKSPGGLPILALSRAYLALALARQGNTAEVAGLLKPLEQVLRLCVDPGLKQMLVSELGWAG